MNYLKINHWCYLIIFLILIACEGEVGPQGVGLNSLTNVTTEPSGVNCENGGVKIEVGTDANQNGILDSDEVVNTSYVCNGLDGLSSLTVATAEPAGANCESGGLKIDVGLDSNGNGTLDDTEISATAYICNGIDGNSSLTKITTEEAGANCENGGLRIDVGIDANSNGTLDDAEISTIAYVCNGIDGNNGLIKTTNEPSGDNCENGGLKIDSGVDSNNNGTLDDSEITATAYVCNGIDGSNTLTKLTSEAEGDNCENGGVKIDSGVDNNNDGILDNDEITATAYVCNGDDGSNALTKFTTETEGANCENGGIKIDSGVDSNNDGTLDDGEITATTYVCNGIDGSNTLTKLTTEAEGDNCENGGVKIDSGVDNNNDGILDDDEITATAYACNGVDGNVSLVNVSEESVGDNCENGGIKIESGVDENGDGILDNVEIDVTRYVCNGIDGGFDEQIYIYLLGEYSNSSSTYSVEGVCLIDFDKSRYLNVDSIVFVGNPWTFSTTGLIDLYNITDDEPISNSEISTTNGLNDRELLKSGNIYQSLPSKSIDIGVRVKSEPAGGSSSSGEIFLVLYRNN